MNEPIQKTETTIYQQGEVHITNLRAVFHTKTYAISNITSVDSQRIEASGCAPAFLVILGIFLALFGIGAATGRNGDAGDIVMIIIGAVMVFGGAYVSRTAKPTYAVNLTTAAGEVKAYTSADETTIKNIVEALNNAIIQKG
jgi:hypothetical protein